MNNSSNSEITSTPLYQLNIWDVYTRTGMSEKQLSWWGASSLQASVYLCSDTQNQQRKILIIQFTGTHRDRRADTFALIDIRDKIIQTENPDGVLIDLSDYQGFETEESQNDPMPRILHYQEGNVSIPIVVVANNEKLFTQIHFSIIDVGEDDEIYRQQDARLFKDFQKAWKYLQSMIMAGEGGETQKPQGTRVGIDFHNVWEHLRKIVKW